jgi:osmotically-inducible protein OsmY
MARVLLGEHEPGRHATFQEDEVMARQGTQPQFGNREQRSSREGQRGSRQTEREGENRPQRDFDEEGDNYTGERRSVEGQGGSYEIGESEFANQFDEARGYSSGRRAMGRQGSQSQGYQGYQVLGSGEDLGGFGAGAYGQESYRGRGGDRSQSGGRRDYGGGYGGGQGDAGHGYQGSSRSEFEAAQGFRSDYGFSQSQESEGQFRGRGPKGYRRSDERVTEEINDRLTDHPAIDAENIDVSVKDGEVTLSGTVDDRHAKRMAEDVAWQVGGVAEVSNQLRIKRQGEGGASTSHLGGAGHSGRSKS